MESVNVQQYLKPCTNHYRIQNLQPRDHGLRARAHTSPEDESVELEENKNPQARRHSTAIEHNVCSPLSEHSSRRQQDQQQHRERQYQPGSRHSSAFEPSPKRSPGSLTATVPPCSSSCDGEAIHLAVDCSDSSSSCLLRRHIDKSLPLSPPSNPHSYLIRAKDGSTRAVHTAPSSSFTLESLSVTDHSISEQAPIGYRCTDSSKALASKALLSETSVPQRTVPSSQRPSHSANASTSSPSIVLHRTSTPIETSVTITTTLVGSSSAPNPEDKAYYSERLAQHQQQLRRRHGRILRRLFPTIEIHPLWCLHQADDYSVPSDLRARILRSLDYLEYLETCLLSDKEAKALKRRRRLQSLIAIKDFVSHRILGLGRSNSTNGRDSLHTLHSNHSAPLIDRTLLSPSPSPSLPVLRSTPNTFGSRPSSRAASIVSAASLARHQNPSAQAITDTEAANLRRYSQPGTSTPHRASSSSSLSLVSSDPSASLANIRAIPPRDSPTSSGPSLTSPTPLNPSLRLASRSSWPSRLHAGFLKLRSSSSTPTSNDSPLSRLQGSHLDSNLSFASTTSASSSSSFHCNAHIMPHSRLTASMSQHPSPSQSSLASSSASCSSSMSPHTNTSSYATVSRTSYRKTGSGQHPLAVVSTFDSDHDSSDGADNSDSIIGYTRHATSRGTHLEQFSTVSTQTADAASSAESSKDKHLSTSTHNSVWANKQSDSSIFKDTKSEPEHLYMLHTKSETSIGSQDTTHERDWASVAIASGVDQPISPLDASCSVMVSPFVLSTIDHTLTAPDVEQPQTPPPPESTTATPPTPSTPSKRADFEMWTPPPPRERQQPQQQPALRQPQSRLPIHKILKHRSFYFPFSSSQSGDPSSSQNGVNQSSGRASTDGLSEREGCNLDNQRSRATGSCDIPRSVGPPDPIPPHYQHLQNRQSLLPFRRRSHGGELDRLPTGWVVNEGAILTQGTPRTSVSDDQSPNTVPSQAPTPRRQISSGAQPSSRWGRLFTSFFPSGSGSENRDRENSNRESNGDDGDVFLSHQRLLLATSNQYTQQPIHPMYQQQLFFYADEVVDRADSSNAVSRDEDYMYQGGSSSEGGSDREDAPPFIPFSMSSLEANTVLQRELAQEDRHESMEIMNSDEPTYERSSTPTILTGDGFVVPKTLSSDGKIPVSSLALSSPPSYWESAIKYQGWPKIEPRPEQGQEDLPRYTCSVFREGCVNRKTELIGNWRPYRRPWKRTFAHLRGTALRLYAVDSEDVPRLHVRNISLQMAKCEMATDYRQRTNVIRIQSCDRTVLFECKDRVDALTWLEHLQAAANIATSLEDRLMPKFHTLPRAPAPSGARGSRAQSTSSTISSVSSHQSSTDHQEQQSEPMQQDHQTNLEQSPPSPPQGPLRERQRQLSVEQPSSSQPTPYQQLQQILQSQQEQILMIQNRVHQQKLAQQLEVQSNMSASVLNRGSGLVADPEESEPAQLPSSSHSNRRVSGNDSSQDQQQHQSRRPSQSQSTQQTRLAEEDQQHEARLRDEDAVTRSMLHALGQSSESDSSSDDDDLDSEEDEPRSRRHASRRRHHDATSLATFRQRQQQRQQQLQAQQQEQSQQTNGSHQESTTASNETPALVSARPAHHRERYRQVEEQVRAYRGEDWEQAYAVYARQQELQIELREREQRQGQRQEQRRQRASWNRRMFFGLWGHHDPHVTATMAASQAQQHHDQPLALAAYT